MQALVNLGVLIMNNTSPGEVRKRLNEGGSLLKDMSQPDAESVALMNRTSRKVSDMSSGLLCTL